MAPLGFLGHIMFLMVAVETLRDFNTKVWGKNTDCILNGSQSQKKKKAKVRQVVGGRE